MDQHETSSAFDVVIIGSGIGGLTAASLLSKAGLSVCVLEKEPHPGGYLAGFRRKDFRFDTAIHWMNQYSEEGMVCKLFDVIGSDYPRAICQERIRLYKNEDSEYLLTNNPDELKAQWQKEFPEDAKGIERFFKAAKKVGKAFKNFGHIFRSEETMGFWEKLRNKGALIRFGMYFIPHLGYTGEKGMKKGLSKYFSNPRLHNIFCSDTELLSCLVPVGWAYNNDFQSPPQGGGQVIAEWLEHTVNHFGQTIRYRSKVTQVLTAAGNVTGVSYNHNNKEHSIQCKYVIAACDATFLYEKLLPPSLVSEKIKRNLGKAELYSSSVTVSIALDCTAEALGFNQELVHLSSATVSRLNHSGGDPALTEMCILAPSTRDKSLAPEGNGTLLLFMPAQMGFENQWRTEKDEQGNIMRGTAYKELKESIAQQLIKRVEDEMAPGLQKHILFYEVATPVTHWRYTGNAGGSMMGTKPNRFNMMKKVATYHTPAKNLFIGGHCAELGGGVPIAVKAGANSSLLILKKEKKPLYNILADYIDGKKNITAVQKSGLLKPYPNNWQQQPTPAQKKKLRDASHAVSPLPTEQDG
jgi:prolycopene isomerase